MQKKIIQTPKDFPIDKFKDIYKQNQINLNNSFIIDNQKYIIKNHKTNFLIVDTDESENKTTTPKEIDEIYIIEKVI